jgi:hypothetical protein
VATLGPKSYCFRASCHSVEIRLRVEPDSAWIVVRAPGVEPRYRDIDAADVDAVVKEFQSIGHSVERFEEFVNRRAHSISCNFITG